MYNVVYDANFPSSNGGQGEVPSSGAFVVGAFVPVAANPGGLTYSNHVLLGWAYSESATTPDFIVSGNSVSPSIFTMGAFGVTLYAVWGQAPSYYSVVYDGNGNTGGSAPVDGNSPYVSGSSVMVLGNTGNLVKSNYTFLGWSPSNLALVPTYGAGSLFIISANTILYAVWGSIGGGGGFDGGEISNSLELKCKFPYLANAPSVFNWMTNAPLDPSDYAAFLRFKNVTTGDPALSTDIYGLLVRNDDPVNYHAVVGVNNGLYVREHLFVGGYMRIAENILPLEKWKNNFPTPVIPSNKILDVDLGSTTWPFHDITTLYGHIDNLTVPEGINTDWIQSLSKTDLTIASHAGQKIKLDGDVQITGTLTGGGQSGGGTFNGGEITKPLEIKCKFPYLNGMADEVREWIFRPAAQLDDYSAFIRFTDINQGNPKRYSVDIYGATVTNGLHDGPGLMVGHHLYFRGDMLGRGILCSYEGVVSLHGGFLPAGIHCENADRRACGWTPTHNPVIRLAEAGMFGVPNKPKADTLEIRVVDGVVDEKFVWGWGHLEANRLKSHGTVFTDHLSSLSGNANSKINLNNFLVPVTNETVDLGEPYIRFRDIYCRHGNFGDVRAPEGVTAEDIYSPTRGASYIQYRSPNNITLDGNVTITGTLTGGGSLGGVLKGDGLTDATTGEATVQFSSAFPSGAQPRVVCTPVDSQGRTISIVITECTNKQLTVKATIANSAPHIHKLGTAWASSNDELDIISGGKHRHSVAGTTSEENHDINHSHTIPTGTSGGYDTSSEGNHSHTYTSFTVGATTGSTNIDHTHGLAHASSKGTTGTPSTGSVTSHTHQYDVNYINSQTTNSGGGSHTHGVVLGSPTGYSTSSNGAHTHRYTAFTQPTSTNANALNRHYHTFAAWSSGTGNLAADAEAEHGHRVNNRGFTLRDQQGTALPIGGALYTGTVAQTDIYSETATVSNAVGAPVQVSFYWIAL